MPGPRSDARREGIVAGYVLVSHLVGMVQPSVAMVEDADPIADTGEQTRDEQIRGVSEQALDAVPG